MSSRWSESGVHFSHEVNQFALPGPGEYPYRCGIHTKMYQEKPWTIRQYAGFGNSIDANQRLRELIASGVQGLSVAFDLPTQMGFDPDEELAIPEVGKVGVSVSTLDDMRELFDGIDLADVSISMTINATAPILLMMLQLVAEEQGVDLSKLRGTIQNDILKEFISRGTQIFPVRESMLLATETIRYCVENLPNWNPISISGYHMSEAGASPIHEIAFAFSNGIEYIEALKASGVSIDSFAPRLTFFFASRLGLLEEIAKFRAAREVWAKIMCERFGAKNEKSLKLRFHAQTAGVQLTSQNPHLNISRITLQALSAIFGGAQSLHTNAYDEAINLPTEESALMALKIQHVIQKETDIINAIDPFRGSFLIENMTNDFVELIFKEIGKIDELGGAVAAIENGYQQEQIERNAFEQAMMIERGERKVVGVNFLPDESPASTSGNPNQISRTFTNRNETGMRELSGEQLQSSLQELRVSAITHENLLPSIKSCLQRGASLGQICGQLRAIWGTHNQPNSH